MTAKTPKVAHTNPDNKPGAKPPSHPSAETNPRPKSGPTIVASSPSNISPSLKLSPKPLPNPQSTSTATENANKNIISSHSERSQISTTQTSLKTNQYGVDPLNATQSLGNSSAVQTTIPTKSHVSRGSNIGPIVGGVLGSLVFIVIALLCIRRRRQKYQIAPSSEYLANQYPFPLTSEVSCLKDDFISDGLRPNSPLIP